MSPKEKQATPKGGICFSWTINEGSACESRMKKILRGVKI